MKGEFLRKWDWWIVAFSAALIVNGILFFVVGFRGVDVGTDTFNYKQLFENYVYLKAMGTYEAGFLYFTGFIWSLSSNVGVFFGSIFLLITFVYYFSAIKFFVLSDIKNIWLAFLFCIVFLLLSSWYLSAVITGLRQGISLPFLYLSIAYGFQRKFLKAIVFYVVSISFHLSAFLFLPFFFFIFVNVRYLSVFFVVSALMYFLNATQYIVSFLSTLTGVPLHQEIISYAENGVYQWVGFQWDFFVYSIFWFVLLWGMRFIRLGRDWNVDVLLVVYSTLMLPYFWFGYGAYSNRFAFFSWFFTPIILSAIFSSNFFSLRVRLLLLLILFPVSLSYFLFKFS